MCLPDVYEVKNGIIGHGGVFKPNSEIIEQYLACMTHVETKQYRFEDKDQQTVSTHLGIRLKIGPQESVLRTCLKSQ